MVDTRGAFDDISRSLKTKISLVQYFTTILIGNMAVLLKLGQKLSRIYFWEKCRR